MALMSWICQGVNGANWFIRRTFFGRSIGSFNSGYLNPSYLSGSYPNEYLVSGFFPTEKIGIRLDIQSSDI